MKNLKAKLHFLVLLAAFCITVIFSLAIIGSTNVYANSKITYDDEESCWAMDLSWEKEFYINCKLGKTYQVISPVEEYNHEFTTVNVQDTSIVEVDQNYLNGFKIKPKKGGSTIIEVYGYSEIYFDEDTPINDTPLLLASIQVNIAEGRAIDLKSKIYKNSRSATVLVTNAKKGDIAKLKIGKKTYTKKIKC